MRLTAAWTRLSTLVVIGLLLGSLNRPVAAQDVTTGEATATVLAGLQVIAFQDLQFGELLQGVSKTMPNTDDDSSGIFQILGAPSRGISIYMAMPAYLSLPDGSDRLNISFSTTDATVDTTVATPSTVVAGDGWIDQNPYNMAAPYVIGTAGQTNIYLGGKVTPSIDQAAGDYAGDIIVSVAYNGN
ncbi:MAG: hypothetical protein OEW00_01575 [candidate division Zixibacteria bacterium]|nr:hypothetical protein [candidate division Zixibacteria bacterium]